MPLSAGSKLAGFEILAPIGKGGMGEVYRARDTKLARDVALKVLPEAFSGFVGPRHIAVEGGEAVSLYELSEDVA